MLFDAEDFSDLFPDRGQPGLCPRRLALVTALQFHGNLSDRQAADAVRARIDWQNRVARCPEGATSTGWYDTNNDDGQRRHKIHFPKATCLDCNARALCTKAKQATWQITLTAKRQCQALQKAWGLLASDEGHKRYARRAGIEDTLSQAVRAFGARRSRDAGLAKNHLKQVATAAAINPGRLAAWFDGRPQATTRTSRFAALAA